MYTVLVVMVIVMTSFLNTLTNEGILIVLVLVFILIWKLERLPSDGSIIDGGEDGDGELCC